MSDSTQPKDPAVPLEIGTREKLGPVDGDPVTTHPNLEALSPQVRALREAVIQEFKARKIKKYVEKQVEQINTNRRVAEGIKFLFDEHGLPPANAPMEDIIEERKRIEYQIKWFDAMLTELRNRLVRVKEIEDHALDLLSHSPLDE
jgi:hypothetical protein